MNTDERGFFGPRRRLFRFQRLKRPGNLRTEDDSLPLNFGLLEVDQETKGSAGGSKIRKTLRSVFVGEALYALELDHQHVFHKEIREIFSDIVALVGHGK